MKRILAVLPLLLLLACTAPQKGPRTAVKGDRIQVFLEYRGRAVSVSAVGDFNEWQPRRDVFQDLGGGRWRLSLELLPGRYAYLLRVERDDGIQLMVDPLSTEEIEDGLGRRLSVLDLGAAMGDTTGKK